MDIISLTKKLLSFNTINPPGNESEIARFVGEFLSNNGFIVRYPAFEENRLHLVAEKGLSPDKAPIVLSGHFDTVPLGNKGWSMNPFAGWIKDNRLWGRGSSDMKGGLAAMILASVEAFADSPPEGGIRIIISAGEEQGCQGVAQLVREDMKLGKASAIIVGEPTANLPIISHKGALYLKAVASGKTAHSSMPELGVNAIYKAVRAITEIIDFDFETEPDPLLGYPSINVGTVNGGMNINSVPDNAEFTIDIRSTTKVDHASILSKLKGLIGDKVIIQKLVDINPLYTPGDDPFVRLVHEVCNIKSDSTDYPRSLPYLTDGAVLQTFYNGAPTVILGPGQPELAHQTDEFCYIDKLEKSVNLYREIILKWSRQNDRISRKNRE